MSFDIQMMNITVYVNKKMKKNYFKVESGIKNQLKCHLINIQREITDSV